jgi:hypothetical protein
VTERRGRVLKNEKQENVIQNKIQDFNTTFFQKRKFHCNPSCEVGSV